MGTSTMTGRLSYLTLLVVLGSLMTVPARAQSIEELKAMVLKLQARVDQLEAGQKTEPPKAEAGTGGAPAACAAGPVSPADPGR